MALPPYGVMALFAADGVEKRPNMGMNHAPARRVGALFARRSPAHKQKVCQRGLRGKGLIMRKNAWLVKVNDLKITE
jgi:hypothetical protein